MVAPNTLFGKSTGPDASLRSNAEQQLSVRGDRSDDAASRGRKQQEQDEQNRQAENTAMRSVKMLNSRFAPTSARQAATNATQVEIVANVMRHMERMRQNGRGAMTIDLPIANGKTVRISLRMSGNRISVRFDAPSEAIYQALHNGWADLAEQAATRGIKLDAPAFTRNNSDLLDDELKR